MANGEKPPPASAGNAARRARVAIVDADQDVVGVLDRALQNAGFEPVATGLCRFPDGRSALAALVAGGVDVIVYDIGPSVRSHDPDRVRDFFNTATDAGIPLLISTMARWLLEEQTPVAPGALGARGSPAVDRLLSAIERALAGRGQA